MRKAIPTHFVPRPAGFEIRKRGETPEQEPGPPFDALPLADTPFPPSPGLPPPRQLVQRTFTWETPCLSVPEDVILCVAGAESRPTGGNPTFFLKYYQTAMQCVHIYVVPRPAPVITACGIANTPPCSDGGGVSYTARMGEEVSHCTHTHTSFIIIRKIKAGFLRRAIAIFDGHA
jgi:hypothetical protein